ncbi:MAG TPA: DUF4238 domain-containing protein [Candidatus Wujingus californicus]|uniref:DUF4238 domain-containing protein n=1 Tax=Candidatus Wujingus californicus TaxID=3367618 RepID=UPI004027D374|nr:DUF4238 domain-containing protein [Planctomycetota bacterium]
MAGVRHHILPRFLLKGFASRVQGGEVFTFVYRKNKPPFETNIINIGAEKYFYGERGEVSADDVITTLDSEYSYMVEELRGKGDRVEVLDTRGGEFVVHLLLRAKLLRDFFKNSFVYLTDAITEYFSDTENVKKYFKKHPGLIEEKLKKKCKNHSIPRRQRVMFMKKYKEMLPNVIENQKQMLEDMCKYITEYAIKEFPKIVKNTHNKALAEMPPSGIKVDRFKHLRWFVFKPTKQLILGDAGCLYEMDGKKRFGVIYEEAKQIKNIFLPLSSHCMLAGISASESQFNFDVINEAIARCSQEYFVCSSDSNDLLKLRAIIGEEAAILTNDELEQIVDELMQSRFGIRNQKQKP